MPKINKWVIPKNIDKPVGQSLNGFNKPFETVYEIKSEYDVPSFEEFMKNYEVDEKVENSYKNELGSYEDVRVGKGYGPGPALSKPPGLDGPSHGGPLSFRSSRSRSSSDNYIEDDYFIRNDSDDSNEMRFVAKTVVKATLATGLTAATGGWAPVVGGGIWAGGKLLELNNNDFLQFLGKSLSDIGCDTFSSGLFSSSTVGEFVGKSGVSLKKLENLFEVKGRLGTGYSIAKHNEHRNQGIDYKSSCDICN